MVPTANSQNHMFSYVLISRDQAARNYKTKQCHAPMSADVWVSFWDAPQGVATNKQMTTSTVTAGHHGLSTGTEQVDSGKNAEDAWKFTSIEGIQVMPPVKTNRNGFVAFPLIFFCTCDWLNSARMQQHVRNTEGFNNARWAIGNACHMWAAQVLATLPLKPTLGNHVSSMDPEGENTFAHRKEDEQDLGQSKMRAKQIGRQPR